MTLSQLAEVLEAAARRARELEAEARAERREWVDQVASPLGRRRHVARVRARLAAGLEGAAMLGRRALLSAEALDAELATVSRQPRAQPETTTTRIERRLGLIGGGRG